MILFKKHGINTTNGYAYEFPATLKSLHTYRQFRNNLFHCAYHELKAGGEVRAMMRSNPKIKKIQITKDFIYDFELISVDNISAVMKNFALNHTLEPIFYITETLVLGRKRTRSGNNPMKNAIRPITKAKWTGNGTFPLKSNFSDLTYR